MKHTLFFLALCALLCHPGRAQQNYFTNPVIHGDLPDPSLIRLDSTYYAIGTSSEWAPHHPIYLSSDLVNWSHSGHLFDLKPAWTKSSFWAPEWFVHRGKVYVYYTARRQSDNISCIGVAVADSPTGPFTDHGPIVEFGREAIDAFVLNDHNQLYISWKAYGLDDRPIELLACKLSPDGLRLDGKPFSLLRDDQRRGMEGQHWFKHGNYYYLLYAANGCCGPQSDYAVEVARSTRLEGPYEKYSRNPILHQSKEVLSIGHGTFVTNPDGRMFFLCHAYLRGDRFFLGRQPFLQELRMGEDGWPHFLTGEYASLVQPMPSAGMVQKPTDDFSDDFNHSTLQTAWSWNYPYADLHTQPGRGQLSLYGIPHPGVNTGAALCLRPTSPHYTFQTAVLNRNPGWKGVVMYGDAENLITMGSVGDRLMLKLVTQGVERPLASAPLPDCPVHLRITVAHGTQTAFEWSRDGEAWNTLSSSLPDEVVQTLVRWDRISRPGLYQEGGQNNPALFGYSTLRSSRP